MKRFLQILSYVLVATLASLVTFVCCMWDISQGQTKLEELESIISGKYIGEVDNVALRDAAASAMVTATGDRWSYYISAAQMQSHEDGKNNSYVGIGITIVVREDGRGFDIVQVAGNGGAADAGLLPGDILTHVEGKLVTEEGLDNSAALIQGAEGTFVTVTVERNGEALEFSVERRRIEVEVVTFQMMEGDVGYIKIANFNSRCASESVAAIEQLLEQGAKALLFDVRSNGGGYKDEMVELLDYLLPAGPLFRSEDYSGKVSVDKSDARCLEIPMAVLVDARSYSAAEFFAAALREYEAAIVVGEQTTGKGHFQVTYKLNDGSAVNLSIGRYTTPNGVNLDGVGITPDVEVQVSEEQQAMIYYGTMEPEEDPQIRAALQALRGQ